MGKITTIRGIMTQLFDRPVMKSPQRFIPEVWAPFIRKQLNTAYEAGLAEGYEKGREGSRDRSGR